MATYHINPTVKKRWFKSPQIVYELIKYTEEEQWIDPTYGNGGAKKLIRRLKNQQEKKKYTLK